MVTRSRRATAAYDLDALPTAAEEDTEHLKPIETSRPPKANAVLRLKERLVDDFGQHPLAAEAIARAVVDPASARAQLASPTRERVPGGTLLTINAHVWPPAVCPSPVNPRPAATVQYPAGLQSGVVSSRMPLTSAGAERGGAPALELVVTDPDHLVTSLETSLAYLEEHNDLAGTVGQQGVLRPVLVAACVVHHDNKASPIAIAQTSDGSSRTRGSWEHWGIKPSDLYRLVTDGRYLNSTIATTAKLVDLPIDDLSDEDLARLRVLTIPAHIVVGFEPDAGRAVTFDEAVEAMVAMIHVDPPKPWDTDADMDVKATAILEEFQTLNVPEPLVKYMAGLLTPDEAAKLGFSPELDVRGATIFRVLGDDRYKSIVNAGLRRLSARNIKPHRETRLQPITELMIRPYRSALGSADVKAARTSLHRLIQLPEFAKTPWKVTGRDPDELLQAALKELKSVQVGPACVELAFYATFWLTKYRGLQRVVDRDNPDDTREPADLLRELMSTAHGVKVLAQAVRDGRSEMAPRAVRRDGKLQNKADGTPVYVTSTWVRKQFPRGAKAAASSPRGDEAPEARLLLEVKAIRQSLDDAAEAVKGLTRIKSDDGRALVRSNGVAIDIVNAMSEKLDEIRRTISEYGAVWTVKHGHAAADDGDEDE